MGYSRAASTEASGRRATIRRVLWTILGLNVAVALAKLAYGLATGSLAMQADGYHSLFDGASNVIGLVGLSVADLPADRNHPYGHGKYETYAAAGIGAMLLFAAWTIGSTAWSRLADGGAPPRVDALSFGIMAATIAVNLGVTTWERRMARRLRSDILAADASHTGSDVLVSLGVVAGLAAVRLGFPKADAVIALLVALAIVWAAISVLRRADVVFSDSARLSIAEVCDAALAVPGVLGCHTIRTRGTESDVLVDLHVQVDPRISVAEGHRIAEAVELALCDRFPEVADVLAHLEPHDEYQERKSDAERRSGLLS